MKANKAIIALSLVCASTLALAQTFTFKRSYKVGQSETLQMHMTTSGSMPMDMVMKIKEEITKVYPDGSADLATTMLGGSMQMMGQTRDIPGGGQVRTEKVDQYGVPVKMNTRNPFGGYTDLIRKSLAEGISVGETKKFSIKGEKGEYKSADGSITLVSVNGTTASLTFDMTIDTSGGSEDMGTIHTKGSMEVDTVTKQLITETADTTGMKMPGGMGGDMTVHTEMKKI